MPSIALLGLGKAARDGSGQMKNHTAAILTVVNEAVLFPNMTFICKMNPKQKARGMITLC